MSSATSNVTAYPQNRLNRSTYFKTMFDTTLLPYNKMYNNCNNTLCYTYSKNYIYKPHSAYGMVGTSAAHKPLATVSHSADPKSSGDDTPAVAMVVVTRASVTPSRLRR